jgi:hypothetical protein
VNKGFFENEPGRACSLPGREFLKGTHLRTKGEQLDPVGTGQQGDNQGE